MILVVLTATILVLTTTAVHSSSTISTTTAEVQEEGDYNDDGCTLYMAPSIIPNSGLGLFTTKGYSEENMALHELMPDIVIPYGSPYEGDSDDLEYEYQRDILLGGLKRYDWTSDLATTDNDDHDGVGDIYAPYEEGGLSSDKTHIFEFWPGFGALTNHESFYRNINFGDGPIEEDIPVFDQQSRPHVGSDAFSPFHHKFVTTTQPILEGGELFSSYGDGFFLHKRNNPYWFVPLTDDYTEAKRIMRTFYYRHTSKKDAKRRRVLGDDGSTPANSMSASASKDTNNNDEAAVDVNAPSSFLSLQEKWDHLLEHNVTSPRVKTALTKNVTHLMETQGMEFSLGKNQRSTSWIRKEGICIDRVQMGVSNIFEAGRGIFAKHSIKKDTLIVPVPVIQVNRTLQELSPITTTDPDNNNDKPFTPSLPSHRLIVNYCFSHHKSSMMLCPYISTAALVNHSSDPSKINAKLIFSGSKYVNRNILEESSHQLLEWERAQRSLGLVFDIVATRDIIAGEEIYINYGNEWQTAWDEHIVKWSHYYNVMNDSTTTTTTTTDEGDHNTDDQTQQNFCSTAAQTSSSNQNKQHDETKYGDSSRMTMGHANSNSEAARILKVAASEAETTDCCVVNYNNTATSHNNGDSTSYGDEANDDVVPECIQSFIEKVLRESPLQRHYHTPSTACFYYPYWNEDDNLLLYDDAIDEQEDEEHPERILRGHKAMKAFEWRYEYYYRDWMIDIDNSSDDDDADNEKPLVKTSTVGGLYPCHILAKEENEDDEYYTVLMLIDHDSETMEGLDYDIVEEELENDDDEENVVNVNEFYNEGKYTRRQVQLVKHVPSKALRYGMTQKWRDLGVVDHSRYFDTKTITNQDDNDEDNYVNGDKEFRRRSIPRPPPPPPPPFRHYIGVPDDVFPEAWKDLQ